LTGITTIDHLARESRPKQFALLDRMAAAFAVSPAVSHLLIRGSLATGTADRMSDVDFVVAVREAEFIRFAGFLDLFMSVEFGTILPCWPDTIVRRMGGLGHVFLLVHEGQLYQTDIYLAPEGAVPTIQAHTGARLLYGDLAQPPGGARIDPDVAAYVDRELNRPPGCTDLLVEVLVLVQMMRKRIKRGQQFVVYSEHFLLTTAVKELIKKALTPTSAHWGWYHLDEEIGVTPTGRTCLAKLATLINRPPVRTLEELADVFRRIEHIAELAVPEALELLAPAVAAYKQYLELA
jgi:predicted nucleotidyltransferase